MAPVPAKIARPRPLQVLARPRLFRALDQARARPVVWIAAPPGAGKTTLVSTYISERRLRTVWYQVDAGDGDPATFFHYLGLAADAAVPRGKRKRLPHFTPEYLRGLPEFTQRYFEQFYQSLKSPCLLVLDNYQDAPSDAVLHEVIRQALASLPAGINVILLSRAEPPPELARLRANSVMAFLGWEELKLTAEECSAIARLRKVQIERTALHEVYERTQGWTAGVVLALEQASASATQATLSPGAAPQAVFDYFAGEIFERMGRESQAILLQAALLPTMPAARVVALTGAAEAEHVLADLNRRNYFTLKQRHAQAAYQFHPLFREFLLARARVTFTPEFLKKAQHRAAALLEAGGETTDAVALFVEAEAWDDMVRIIPEHAQTMLDLGRGSVLEAWLRGLPPLLLEQTPWLLFWFGMCRLAFDPATARAHFERAFHLFDKEDNAAGVTVQGGPPGASLSSTRSDSYGRASASPLPPTLRTGEAGSFASTPSYESHVAPNEQLLAGLFLSWCGIVDTFVYEWGDFHPMDRWIAVFDDLVARHPSFPSPKIAARAAAGMFTALMYRQPQRSDLPRWAQQVRTIVLSTPDVRTQMILGNQLLHYLTAWLGDFPNSRLLLEAVPRPADAAELGPIAHIAWCAMEAGYYLATVAPEECLRAVNDGLDTADRTGARFMSSLLLSQGTISSLTAGDLATAERLLQNAAATMAGGRQLDRAHYFFLVSLNAFYRRDTVHALVSAREAVALGDAAGVPFCQALYRVALAHALFDRGERREAQVCSAQARRIAKNGRMTSIEFGCLYSGVYFALERGKQRLAIPLLRKTLGIAKQRGYASRPFWTPEIMMRLFATALEHGIEVDYVQGLIRRRKLMPTPEVMHLEHWPWSLKVYTLGGFRIEKDGEPMRFAGKVQRRPLDLLKITIALGGREVDTPRIIDGLWPEADGDAAADAFAAALRRLRLLLGDPLALALQDNKLSLDRQRVWVDAWALDHLLNREVVAGAGPLMALYRGAFLDKEANADWAWPLRERLSSRFLRELAKCGQVSVQHKRYEEAIALFEKGLEADELAEEIYGHLMRCYQAMGRRADGLGVYERCRRILSTTLGVAPSPETEALRQALLGDTSRAVPPER